MFRQFTILYRCARWNCLRSPDWTPWKEGGSRANPLSAFLSALNTVSRDLWGQLTGARRRQMEQEERDLMACDLPRRLTHGERYVNDAVGLNVRTNKPISNEEADQILKESQR